MESLDNYHLLPESVQGILESFDENTDNQYEECERVIRELEQEGYAAEYGLDGELLSLEKFVEVDAEVIYNGYYATVKEISQKDHTVKIVTTLFEKPTWVGLSNLKPVS